MSLPLIMFIFVLLMILMNFMINMPQSDKLNMKLKSQFECGFNHFSFMRPSFSIQFFMLGVMFLIFDLEISIILPCFLSEENSIFLLMFISYIFILLTFFYFLEWKNGSISWVK